MKTIAEITQDKKTQLFENETKNNLGTLLKALLIVLVLTTSALQSQTKSNKIHTGFNFECLSSGNGHGLFYAPGLQFTQGRHTLGVELLVQKRSMQANGARLFYQANLTGEPCGSESDPCDRDLIQVNIFSYVHYNQPALLSFGQVSEANKWVGDRQPNWQNTLFSTVEGGAGFQVQYNISQKTSANLSFASSYYYHPVYTDGLFVDRSGPGLFLGLGIQTHF